MTTDVEVLEKRLGLLDVYTICVGAMFASGFFFLPGVAAGQGGPSVVLAYAVSAVLMVPAMYSIAELSSAMPRAGGAYYFIHRSLGPWFGVVGGIGLWLTLVLKSAFALVGMGAYLAIFLDVPMVPVAIALTVVFGLLNTVGVKQTAWLQNLLVFTLVPILVYFVVAGLLDLQAQGLASVHAERFTPFLPFGSLGFVSTVGLVSISYAGLTKVASAAEEVKDLDRNMPLGMGLALLTAAAIYVGGVYVMVGSIAPDALRGDLTPAATAANRVLQALPGELGLGLVVVAAIAAFASTGNAGIFAASRYPLAMARDRLVWNGFERLGRFTTPGIAIWTTCAAMAAAILFLDVEKLAKLGSAFILVTFVLINLAVIIMRESRIEAYAPGYRSPLYPWMQIVGVVAMLGLITTMGLFAVLFVAVIVAGSAAWYRVHAKGRVPSRGAIYTYLGRLSQRGETGVDDELWTLLQERGASTEDSYERLVAGARTLDLPGPVTAPQLLDRVAEHLAEDLGIAPDALRAALEHAYAKPVIPQDADIALIDVVLDGTDDHFMEVVRLGEALRVAPGEAFPGEETDETDQEVAHRQDRVDGVIFLLHGGHGVTQHLRIIAELASQVEDPDFARRWQRATTEEELREALLRRGWFVVVAVEQAGPTADLHGRRVREVDWPPDTLAALVRRDGRTIFPRGDTRLEEGDRLTVIGPPDAIEALFQRYVSS